jgi:hypothetical protein
MGAVAAILNIWLVRPLILGYPPVAALVRGALEKVRLGSLLTLGRGLQTPPQ